VKLGFVCTNYNNSSFTRQAVASLHAGGRWNDVRVAVVDNGSRHEDIASLKEMIRDYPRAELILNPKNAGYFPGLNVGIRHLRTRFPEVEHIVVGNNDLVFPERFVETLERNGAIFDTWAVVSPDLVTPEGDHQNPHVLHPVGWVRKLVWDVYFSSYWVAIPVRYAARVTRRFTAREENTAGNELHRTPGPIEQGYGACYILGPVFFRHFSRLCAPTFMMQEEFFLCEQLKSIGQMMYYDPRFVVQHHGHATMARLPSRRHYRISQDAHRIYQRYLKMPDEERRALIAVGSGDRL
jgi:GT2 family glycosyltransferase